MKKNVFGAMTIALLSLVLSSCSKQDFVEPVIGQVTEQTYQVALEFDAPEDVQVIPVRSFDVDGMCISSNTLDISGKYVDMAITSATAPTHISVKGLVNGDNGFLDISNGVITKGEGERVLVIIR